MLGIASLSALGPFGAAVEITVILYPYRYVGLCSISIVIGIYRRVVLAITRGH